MKAFKPDGYDLPKIPQNVRDIYIKNFQDTLEVVESEIRLLKQFTCRFLISFDELTSKRKGCYMNLNLYAFSDYFSSGMIRINGSMTVKHKLFNFNVEIECNIVTSVSVGARVIQKFGRETSPIYVTCLACAQRRSSRPPNPPIGGGEAQANFGGPS